MIKLNGRVIAFGEYPNNEINLPTTDIKSSISPFDEQEIVWKYEDDRDIWKLIALKKHLDSIRCARVRLVIAYMPYSRMELTQLRS